MSEVGDNSIIGYVIKDETDENYYHAYIGSDGNTYTARTFPVGPTNSITLTKEG